VPSACADIGIAQNAETAYDLGNIYGTHTTGIALTNANHEAAVQNAEPVTQARLHRRPRAGGGPDI
jgi:hypothetical protein